MQEVRKISFFFKMETLLLFTFVILLIIPLLLGVLSHLWSIQHQKKRHNNLFTQPQPLTIIQQNSSSRDFTFEDTKSRLSRIRTSMDEKREEKKAMRRKVSLQNLDVEEVQRQAQAQAAAGQQTSPMPSPLKKSSSTRTNCLCSPTTHAGSFRCRHHRHGATKSNMRRGHSVGSNLSDLANKFSSNPTTLSSSSLAQMSMPASSLQMH